VATITLSASVSSARATALLNAIGSGAALTLYTGAIPSSPDATATGSLLATLTLRTPFGVVTGNQLVAGAIPQVIALQSGQAGYGRITTSSGAAICDLDVGIAGSGAAVVINSNVLAAAPVIVAGLTISE
jgi:hypothetical protein